jgi:hypothetical protein
MRPPPRSLVGGVALPVALTCASLLVAALVHWVLQRWCARPEEKGAAPAAAPGSVTAGGLSASDLAAVESDADLDLAIAQLEKLHAHVDSIEARARQDMAAAGRDYDAWAKDHQLTSAQERVTSSKLAALKRLRAERAAAKSAVPAAPATGTIAPARRDAGDGSAPDAAELKALLQQQRLLFQTSPYTRKWREHRARTTEAAADR